MYFTTEEQAEILSSVILAGGDRLRQSKEPAESILTTSTIVYELCQKTFGITDPSTIAELLNYVTNKCFTRMLEDYASQDHTA